MRKKILFWIVWSLVAPFVFAYYFLNPGGSVRAWLRYWAYGLPWIKTGMVRQAVFEKLVLQKPAQRHLYNLYRKRRF